MTSFAFILGVLPLFFASGAGGAARRALGTAVLGGMLAATLLAVFIVPVLFTLMERVSERRKEQQAPAVPAAVPVHAGGHE
jgi:multidrug efflux pump subunit AcrB